MARRRGRAVGRLPRPEGRRLPADRHRGDRAAAGQVRHRPRLHRGVLRLRARPGLLAHQALRPPGRPHPRLLAGCAPGCGVRDEAPPGSTGPPEPAVTGYVLPGPDPRVRADHAAVRDAIGRPGRTLLDVRSWDEYRGERGWPSGGLEPGGQAGHVPSAVHQPLAGLYHERGAFRDHGALPGVFSAVDLDGADELITYCTIGGRACTAWFVLTYLLGRESVRGYDGSGAEWGGMPEAPG